MFVWKDKRDGTRAAPFANSIITYSNKHIFEYMNKCSYIQILHDMIFFVKQVEKICAFCGLNILKFSSSIKNCRLAKQSPS